jgi:peptidoglycan/LPS O-acetylase OafA/YrhL
MRNKRLDILRCVAILLVVAAHAQIWSFTTRVGWIGVDLFFVLSGFLISGLLYSEYKQRQDISFRRFFVRRGLKIYPAFYLLLLATFAAQHLLWHGTPERPIKFFYEAAFIQNYFYGIWTHTWSLAVEEHFYLGLALLLLILARISKDRLNPFRSIPWVFAGVAGLCLALRAWTIWIAPPTGYLTPHVMNPTHTRMDGLFFGVLLGYFYHFHRETFQNALRPAATRLAIGVISLLLLTTPYLFDRDSHFLLSIGLTLIYLGFGGLLVLALEARDILKGHSARVAERMGTGLAYVGQHSYSIYLWHVPFLVVVPVIERKILHTDLPTALLASIYIVGSCALGIFFANLVEFPVLRFRDRFFPMLQKNQANRVTAPEVALPAVQTKP